MVIILAMGIGLFAPPFGVGILTASILLVIFTAVGVPFFTVTMVYMAGRMQPASEERLSGNVKVALLAAIPAAAVAVTFGGPWVSAAVGLFSFLVLYGLSVRDQMREMKEVDEALPEFLKDLLEYKRQEYDLTKSLLSIGANNRYNPSFDKITARIDVQLKAGTPVNELKMEAKTRLARMVFLVIGEMGQSGGGTVDTVFQLSAYTSKVVDMKKNTPAEMRPYLVLSYASPVLLAFGVTFVGGILRSFGSSASAGISALRLSGFQFGETTPLMTEASSILIVVTAAALGVIGAKMVDFTVRNTLRASLNVVVAVAATVAFSSIGVTGFFQLFH